MPTRYELLAPAFHNAAYQPRGAIVTLRDDELPGPHMRLYHPPAPPSAPIVVDERTGAPLAEAAAAVAVAAEAEPPPQSIAARLKAAMAPVAAPLEPGSPGYLILDTETNGFKDPRMAAAAMIFLDRDLRVEVEYQRLVRPIGWTMDPKAQAVNGLSMEELTRRGCLVIEPMIVFELALAWGRTVVCHNAEFDLRVMRNEWAHARRGAPGIPIAVICTMQAARRMTGNGTLAIAYEKLMNEPLIGGHDAMVDARACLEVLRAMRKRGLDLNTETQINTGGPL